MNPSPYPAKAFGQITMEAWTFDLTRPEYEHLVEVELEGLWHNLRRRLMAEFEIRTEMPDTIPEEWMN